MTTTPRPDRASSPAIDDSGFSSKLGPIPAAAFDDSDPEPSDDLPFLGADDKAFYEEMVADLLSQKVTAS